MGKKEDKCLVTEEIDNRFLGLGRKWISRYYKHTWAYKNSEERKCLICKKRQIFIKTNIYCKKIDKIIPDNYWVNKL